MNQESNNLNQNSFNIQENNQIPNNQPLNNSYNQNIVNSNIQPPQQPVIQTPPLQSTNNTTGTVNNNQSFSTNSPKKKKFSLIIVIAIVLILALVLGKNIFNKKYNKAKNTTTNERYLDISRNLKSEYGYKEIFDSYAVQLNDKTTYIVKENENFKISTLSFFDGYITGMTGYYKTDDGKWSVHFVINTLSESTLDEIKNKGESYKHDIVDETSKYILYSNGSDYAYDTIMDGSSIEVQLASYNDYFTKNKLNKDDIVNIVKSIKSIIKEDDLKEPYLVDKLINVKLNNNYKIKNYLMIDYVGNNDTYYSVGLHNIEDDYNSALSILYGYDTEKNINEYDLTNKINDNPKVYYDKKFKNFIFDENGNKQIFEIHKSDIDGNEVDIKTYNDFIANVKVFLEQNK